ncbi:MAG: type II secretion system GspH family protein [Candidatus Uhrbacteria bacterium]|nr:type II secretion system GspH family protein [Candidatus Uhrbacteria bacterium]
MKSLDPFSQTARGFTLIEVLLSIGIISLLFGFTAMGVSQVSKRLLIGPSDAYLENILTTAARRARDGVQASDWGVYLPYDELSRNLSEVIVFKGSSYAMRDSDFDQEFVFSEKTDFVSVDFSGAEPDRIDDHEVVFELYAGQTSQSGSVALEVFGVSRTIVVSPQGFITREL